MKFDISSGLIGLVIGWGSMVLAFWIFQIVRKSIQRQKYGSKLDHNLLLIIYSRKLIEAKDRNALGALLEEEIPDELDVTRSLFLFSTNHKLISMHEGDLEIPINNMAVRWVAASGEAQSSDHKDLKRIIDQSRTDLHWVNVWVPLMQGTKLLGLWFLGQRSGKSSYSSRDLHFLTSAAREAAAVLELMKFREQDHQSALEIQSLYRQLVNAREEEWERLSRELHDGVLQDLCAITRDLKVLAGTTKDNEIGELLSRLIHQSSEIINELRAICHNLRPPLLQQDLPVALKSLVGDYDARSSAPIHIDLQTDQLTLRDDENLAIFRIVQEALNNAIQHSGASEIAVQMTQFPDKLRLTITDDGRGIPESSEPSHFVKSGHYGLAGMRERAAMVGGKFEIQTATEYGTVVIFELQL